MHVAGPIDDPSYPFWGIIVGVLYGGVFYWGMDQVNVQRVLGARNLDQARWGAMFAALLKLTPIFIFALPGVITYALYPGMSDEESKSTFVVMLNNLLPSGLRGLVLSALLAALISSLLAVMNSVSTMLVRDFILYFKPGMGERVQVNLGTAHGVCRGAGGSAGGVSGFADAGRTLQIPASDLVLSVRAAGAGHLLCGRQPPDQHDRCHLERAGRQRDLGDLCVRWHLSGHRSREDSASCT